MAQETRETLGLNLDVLGSIPATAARGIEAATEFKPIEHPVEPISHDHPITCPQPEHSILNDGRIWKERMSSATTRVRSDMPVAKEGSRVETKAGGGAKTLPLPPAKRSILPSLSAPENILNLLEECT